MFPPTEQLPEPPIEPGVDDAPRRWRERYGGALGLLVVLILGAGARLALGRHEGHLPDVDIFLAWMRGLAAHGFGGFFEHTSCNYPPLYLLILRGLGELLAMGDPGLDDSVALRGWLRLPACAADLLIALLLYWEGRRLAAAYIGQMGAHIGLVAASLYFLNPVALYNSAYWGQVDSIYTFFVLAAVVALNRRRPVWAGGTICLALLMKLQSIVFVPLILLDVYRRRRWRGLLLCLLGAVCAAVLVLAPFVYNGVGETVLRQGYNVVGQYDKLSVKAFNLWQLLGVPDAPSSSVPMFLVRIAAAGEAQVAAADAWYLRFNWRHLSMAVFCLSVAVTLVLYCRRWSAQARALTAGVLALIFFFTLTEMHERYAYPVIAVLPLWACGRPWRERLYMLLSVLLLLNLVAVQPVGQIAGDLAGGLVLILVALAVAIAWSRDLPPQAGPVVFHSPDDTPLPPPSGLLQWFARLTWMAVVASLVVVGICSWAYATRPNVAVGGLPLSTLDPVQQSMGYGALQVDHSLGGGALCVDQRYYLRGLGTHAPATLSYEVPQGYSRFQAVVGINCRHRGRAKVQVFLDGQLVDTSPLLTADSETHEVDIALNGARYLKLRVMSVGSKSGDHVDWALARFVR